MCVPLTCRRWKCNFSQGVGGARCFCGILLGYSHFGTVSQNSPDGEEGTRRSLDYVYFESWLLIDRVPVDIHVSMVMEALLFYQEFGYMGHPVVGTGRSVRAWWVLGCVGECTDQCGAYS